MREIQVIDFLRIPRPFINLTERQTLTRIEGSNEIITLSAGYYTLKDLKKKLEVSSVIDLYETNGDCYTKSIFKFKRRWKMERYLLKSFI